MNCKLNVSIIKISTDKQTETGTEKDSSIKLYTFIVVNIMLDVLVQYTKVFYSPQRQFRTLLYNHLNVYRNLCAPAITEVSFTVQPFASLDFLICGHV